MSPHNVTKLRPDLTPAMAARMTPLDEPAAEARRLEVALTPAAPAEAMEVLQFLFRVLPMANSGETDEEKNEITAAMLAAYVAALDGMPRWAIAEVRGDFMAGRIPGQSLSFAPKPPEFGNAVAARVDAMRAKLSRMRRQAEERSALGEDTRRPLSATAREQGDRRIAELRAAAAAERESLRGPRHREPGYVDPNPITREALEAAGVPDAPPRGTGAMERLVPPAFDPMSRRDAS